MPIEIKELHIRVTVDSASDKEKSLISGSKSQQAPKVDNCTKNAIVADCVEQILQILQEQKER